MTPRYFIYIIFVTLLLASSQNILKLGLEQAGGFKFNLPTLLIDLKPVLTNGFVWLGFLMAGLSVLIWMDVLSSVKLNTAYPLISFSYVFGAVFAYLIFKETLQLSGYLGIGFIVLGTVFLTK